MELFELDDLINDLGIDPTAEQLDLLYAEFKRDFIDSFLNIDGLNVKVILKNSTLEGFEPYPETFVKLITRDSVGGKRVFDRHRANKIHWIRCILDKRDDDDITFFQYPDKKNDLRDYYWFKNGGFLVVMKKISPDYLVITSFHIDSRHNEEYYEKKLEWFNNEK